MSVRRCRYIYSLDNNLDIQMQTISIRGSSPSLKIVETNIIAIKRMIPFIFRIYFKTKTNLFYETHYRLHTNLVGTTTKNNLK